MDTFRLGSEGGGGGGGGGGAGEWRGGTSLGEWEHNKMIKCCSLKGGTVCDHK